MDSREKMNVFQTTKLEHWPFSQTWYLSEVFETLHEYNLAGCLLIHTHAMTLIINLMQLDSEAKATITI